MGPDTPTPLDERLHDDCSESSWRGHTFRYRLASGFCEADDVVVDAACGSGYGKALLGDVVYFGIDKDPAAPQVADLQEWRPDFDFDVFVGFETIEHLPDYTAYVEAAKQARRWIILSTPVVPTTHLNPFHAHNFAPGEIAGLICDSDWMLYQSVVQPSELAEVYVFSRR